MHEMYWKLPADLEHLARERGVLGAESGLRSSFWSRKPLRWPLEVGYETGGAQYQAGLIRGFDPATILRLGRGLRAYEINLDVRFNHQILLVSIHYYIDHIHIPIYNMIHLRSRC